MLRRSVGRRATAPSVCTAAAFLPLPRGTRPREMMVAEHRRRRERERPPKKRGCGRRSCAAHLVAAQAWVHHPRPTLRHSGADLGVAVKQLMAHGSQLSLATAQQLAARRGHEHIRSPRAGDSGGVPNGDGPRRWPVARCAADGARGGGHVRAVEAWLRSGAMSAVNEARRSRVRYRICSSWGGSALDLTAEEDVATVLTRMRQRGVGRPPAARVRRLRAALSGRVLCDGGRAHTDARPRKQRWHGGEGVAAPSVAISRHAIGAAARAPPPPTLLIVSWLPLWLPRSAHRHQTKLASSTHATPPMLPGELHRIRLLWLRR